MGKTRQKKKKQQQEDAAVKKSLSHSIKDGVAYAATTGFGDNYINPFAVALGASNFEIGLLTSVSQLVPSIVQLKAADVTERVGSRKKIVVRSVFLQAAMLLPIATVFYLPRPFQVIALICFYALYMSFSSFAGPAWGSLMANLVPEGKRGAFFGKRGRLIGQTTVLCSFLAGYILNLFEKESLFGFTAIFLLAMVSRFISCYFLGKMHEPPLEVKREHYFSFAEFVRRLPAGNFGKFVIFHCSFSFAVFLSSPFVTVFMLRDLGFSYITYTIVTTAVPVASIVAVKYWGRRADAVGNWQVIRICAIGISTLPVLWLISRNIYFLLAIQTFGGVLWAGFNLCTSNFIYDSVMPEKRTRCIAYFNTFNGLAICIGTFLGGLLVNYIPPLFGYQLLTLFAISSLARVTVASALLGRVREVRKVGNGNS